MKSVESQDDNWDTGEFGRSLEHAAIAENDDEMVDAALNLQPISIRLEKSLIDAFKFIASYNKGIGYQPLMRQVLHRFAASELNRIAGQMESRTKGANSNDAPDIDDPSKSVKAA